MARLSAILLVLCLLVPVSGAYLWLHSQIRAAKKEVKKRIISGMDDNQLVLLKLSRAEAARALRWEHSREFEYKGRMYDVVKTAEAGDTLLFHCWQDDLETGLRRQLTLLVENEVNNDPQKKEQETRVIRFLQTLFPPESLSLFREYSSGDSILFPDLCQLKFIDSVDPPAPPPEVWI